MQQGSAACPLFIPFPAAAAKPSHAKPAQPKPDWPNRNTPYGLRPIFSVQSSVSLYTLFAPKVAPRVRHTMLPHWLTHLGMWGLFSVAIVDSSVIPLPIPGSTDLLLLWLVSHNHNPWLLAPTPSSQCPRRIHHLAPRPQRRTNALRRWVSPRILNRIVVWSSATTCWPFFYPPFSRRPFRSPRSFSPLERWASIQALLAAYGAARTLRYSLVAWLAVLYGRHVVRLWSKELDKWSTPLLYVFLAVSVAGIAVGVWQFRSQRNSPSSADPSLEPETARVD